MLIAHITDIHVADPSWYQDPAERLWIPRIRKHSQEIFERILADLVQMRPDHVVLTGDLTQTSKREEFQQARALIDRSMGGLPVTAIPGNHDRWRREAVEGRWFEETFEGAIPSDPPIEGGPGCRLLDGVALVTLDSAPFVPGVDPARVCGHVSEAQLAGLVRLSEHEEVRSRALVVALHHHLRLSHADAAADDPKDPTPLENAPDVEEALGEAGAALVLHGHRHQLMRLDLRLGERTVPVLCPGSSSRADARVEKTAKYGLYEIEGGELKQARFRMWDPFGERLEWVR